mmetsp:Transcript_33564/g.81149  ORF Transcript_33564/g.81149 Transcript_33564/m.81149 type:complete len:208 (-) Transcript_33564:1781-2404(-)
MMPHVRHKCPVLSSLTVLGPGMVDATIESILGMAAGRELRHRPAKVRHERLGAILVRIRPVLIVVPAIMVPFLLLRHRAAARGKRPATVPPPSPVVRHDPLDGPVPRRGIGDDGRRLEHQRHADYGNDDGERCSRRRRRRRRTVIVFLDDADIRQGRRSARIRAEVRRSNQSRDELREQLAIPEGCGERSEDVGVGLPSGNVGGRGH